MIDPVLWPDAIGFSVYAFEGIGVILPIKEVTGTGDRYFRILCITIISIGVLYVAFPIICVFAFGDQKIDTPIITDVLPPKNWGTWIIKVLFASNLIFSYPLVIHPANIVIESYLFGTWPKTRKRQMSKNVSRTIIVVVSCVVALLVYDKLDKLLSVTGALTCTPIAFTFPALFHWKTCAKTQVQKIIDLTIFICSLVVMVYCTFMAILTFNTE